MLLSSSMLSSKLVGLSSRREARTPGLLSREFVHEQAAAVLWGKAQWVVRIHKATSLTWNVAKDSEDSRKASSRSKPAALVADNKAMVLGWLAAW
jgi:hypothetical protein